MGLDARISGNDAEKAEDRVPRVAACLLGLIFIVFQLWTIDYGTRINDVESIRQHVFAPGSGLSMDDKYNEQKTVISDQKAITESVEKRMMRFKLYSVEPDEHMSIAALHRVRPEKLDFDPDYFQYGGGHLYPLGLWYFALSKLGVINVTTLEKVLNSPDGLDQVYIAGRIFVVMVFALSAWVLYRTLRLVADPWSSTWAIGIYLFVPASIIYSVQIKPHWAGLIWIVAALYVFTRGWKQGRFSLGDEFLLGAFIGLTVAVSPFNFVPPILAGLAVVVAAWRREMAWLALLRVPLTAAAIGFLASPFHVLSWRNLLDEVRDKSSEMHPVLDPVVVWNFATTPLAAGFGAAFVVLLFCLFVYRVVARDGPMKWWAIALLGGIVVFIAILGAGLPERELHIRYMPYFLPIAVLLAVRRPWPYRRPILAAVFVLTVAQSIPLKLAYIDENDPAWSTRLTAAAWINDEFAPGSRLCSRLGVAPANTPPVDLGRFAMDRNDCDYVIEIVRSPSDMRMFDRFEKVRAFTPRLWNERVPFVYGWVNPYIGIYKRRSEGEPGSE